MTKFLPCRHESSRFTVWSVTGVWGFGRVYQLFSDNAPILKICLEVAVFLSIAVLLSQQLDKKGLYITDQKIYYRGFAKFDIRKVAAIKVSVSTRMGGGCPETPNLDKNGNILLSMSFLKPSDEWKQMKNPDQITTCYIGYCYARYHICTVIYDQSALDYLLTLNPDIYVIPFDIDNLKNYT